MLAPRSRSARSFPCDLVLSLLALLAGHAPPSPAAEPARPLVVSIYRGSPPERKTAGLEGRLAAVRIRVEQALARRSDFLLLPLGFLGGDRASDLRREGAFSPSAPEFRRFVAESAFHDLLIVVPFVRQSTRAPSVDRMRLSECFPTREADIPDSDSSMGPSPPNARRR